VRSILLKTAEIKYSRSERILFVRLLEGAEIELEDSKEMFRATMELTGGDKFVALVDGRATVQLSKEAREWGSSPEAHKNLIAQAIWTTSLANVLIGKFIIRVQKPVAKTELFYTEKTALAWLRKQLQRYEIKNLVNIKNQN